MKGDWNKEWLAFALIGLSLLLAIGLTVLLDSGHSHSSLGASTDKDPQMVDRAVLAAEAQVQAAWAAVLVSVIASAGLLVSLWLTRAALLEARKSSEATVQMVAAMMAVEGPILQVKWARADLIGSTEPIDDSAGYSGWTLDFNPEKHMGFTGLWVWNHGRTPAYPINMYLEYFVGPVLPPEPVFYRKPHVFPSDAIIESQPEDDGFFPDVALSINLSDDQLKAINTYESELWIYGAISYRDVLGRLFDKRFCARWGQQYDSPNRWFQSDGCVPATYVGVHTLASEKVA